ncbi:MAG: hypothetical protein HFK10_03485 [Clostridia bacterium]|nr:hypothetical protein [Clostridia bacterium]
MLLTTLGAMPLLEKACRCKRRQRMATALWDSTLAYLYLSFWAAACRYSVCTDNVSVLCRSAWPQSIGLYCIPVKKPYPYSPSQL